MPAPEGNPPEGIDHAPTPWTPDLGTHAVLDADGEELCFCMPARGLPWEEACARRDRTVRFIARAGNAYAPLVKVLDNLVRALGCPDGSYANEAMEDAKAALNAALK